MLNRIRDFLNQPVVVLKIRHSTEMYRAIFEETRALGWGILDLNVTRSSIPPETNVIGGLMVGFTDDPRILALQKKGLPVVRIATYPHPEKDRIIPALLPDLRAAGRLAADHFADRQFKDVAFVGNDPWADEPILYHAFRQRACEWGCRAHLPQVKTPEGKLDVQVKYDARIKQIIKWLNTVRKPIGIFTYHDASAVTIYNATRQAGLNVPEEVAILGYGNAEVVCDFVPVPLSSVDINKKETGRRAIRLLDRLQRGEKAPTEAIWVPVRGIVTRQSTNLLAVPDPLAARALRFIWKHYAEPITIDDVAAVTGVARCTIIGKFKKYIGHSIVHEIRLRRLKKACELLRNPTLPISHIAACAGFASTTYFHSTFRKFYGMTPSEFRRKNNGEGKA